MGNVLIVTGYVLFAAMMAYFGVLAAEKTAEAAYDRDWRAVVLPSSALLVCALTAAAMLVLAVVVVV